MDSFFKSVVKLSSSNIILYFIPLIVTPILSRIYATECFGDWGIFSSTVTIVGVVLLGCYEYVIVKCQNEDIIDIILLCLIVGVCIVVILFLIFIVGSYYDVVFFSKFPQKNLFFVYIFANILLTICQNIANRERLYTILAIGYSLNGITQAILRILFGYLLIFSNGLIAGTVVAQILTTIFMIYSLNRLLLTYFDRKKCFNWNKIKYLANEYRKFPLFDAPASLLAFAAFNLPIIILSIYFHKSQVGCFSVIIQLLLMPISLIGSAIGKVYYQQVGQSENNREQIRNKSFSIIKILVYIAVLPTLFLCLGGNNLVVVFLGEKWFLVGKMAVVLSIWSLPTILTQPLVSIYRITNHQNRLLVLNLIYFVFGVGSILIGCISEIDLLKLLCIYAFLCAVAKFILWIDILNECNVKIRTLPIFYIPILLIGISIWIGKSFQIIQ